MTSMNYADQDVLDIPVLSEGPTLVDHLDQLLLQRNDETRKATLAMQAAKAEAQRAIDEAGILEDELEATRSKLWKARTLNALLLLVAGGGVVVACHPWP